MVFYMALHLIVTRPEYDYTTRYISAWAEKYLKLANQKGYAIVDLRRKRASLQRSFKSVAYSRLVMTQLKGLNKGLSMHFY